eukprot:7704210-Pyramimonas_sp.AAC.1
MEPSVSQEYQFARSRGWRAAVPEAASGSCLSSSGVRLMVYCVVTSWPPQGLSKVLVEHAAALARLAGIISAAGA